MDFSRDVVAQGPWVGGDQEAVFPLGRVGGVDGEGVVADDELMRAWEGHWSGTDEERRVDGVEVCSMILGGSVGGHVGSR